MRADASGAVTATFDYTPYGRSALGGPPDGAGYTGHVNDPDTGLVYIQARYYDPVVGRFLSVDPVGPDPGDAFNFNRYGYANNNPTLFTDPDGRAPQDKWYGYNDPKFQDWVHSEKQKEGRGGARNYTHEEMRKLNRDWKDLKSPRGKGGSSGRGGKWRGQGGFVSPTLLLKVQVFIGLITYSGDLNSSEQDNLEKIREATAREEQVNDDSPGLKNLQPPIDRTPEQLIPLPDEKN